MFVFFSQKKGDPKIVQIPSGSGNYPQGYAIKLKPAGTFSEFMGGFGLKTKFSYPGIRFIGWESFSDAIFWGNESNSFKVFALSD